MGSVDPLAVSGSTESRPVRVSVRQASTQRHINRKVDVFTSASSKGVMLKNAASERFARSKKCQPKAGCVDPAGTLCLSTRSLWAGRRRLGGGGSAASFHVMSSGLPKYGNCQSFTVYLELK